MNSLALLPPVNFASRGQRRFIAIYHAYPVNAHTH